MRWRSILLCLAAALVTFVGCSYIPLKEDTRDVATVTITWTREDILAGCYHMTGSNLAYGCAHWQGGKCHIIAPLPEGQNDAWSLQVLGHEMLHCFKGHWH